MAWMKKKARRGMLTFHTDRLQHLPEQSMQHSGHLPLVLVSVRMVPFGHLLVLISLLHLLPLPTQNLLSRLHQCRSHAINLESLGTRTGCQTMRPTSESQHQLWATLQLISV
jgi:hypothetical protein